MADIHNGTEVHPRWLWLRRYRRRVEQRWQDGVRGANGRSQTTQLEDAGVGARVSGGQIAGTGGQIEGAGVGTEVSGGQIAGAGVGAEATGGQIIRRCGGYPSVWWADSWYQVGCRSDWWAGRWC